MTALRSLALTLLLLALAAAPAEAQRVAKYGADFLAGGVGGRALGMGGAYVALANDVTAGYWNAAGLSQTAYPEVAYMHAERFSGVVQFDYGAGVFPINARSTVGISFFRSGVDDIADTRAATNPVTGGPRANAADLITLFSAADYAFTVSYARQLRPNLSVGATAKVIRRGIGDFASAWGYSADVAARYRLGRFVFGLNLQDVTGMLQSWSIDESTYNASAAVDDRGEPIPYDQIDEATGLGLPEGGAEIVLPVARFGTGVTLPLTDDIGFAAGLDLDFAFDGQRAYAFNTGDVSFHPRLGTELTYRGVVALRAGISDVTTSERFGTEVTPTMGAGLNVGAFDVDYGFGDFGGIRSELGYSHRVSLKYTFTQDRLARVNR
jgi:hypothetical protein